MIGVGRSPDGRLLAATAVSGPITLFEANSDKPVHQLSGRGFGTAANTKDSKLGKFHFDGTEASVLAWSPDDKSLAAGAGSGWSWY